MATSNVPMAWIVTSRAHAPVSIIGWERFDRLLGTIYPPSETMGYQFAGTGLARASSSVEALRNCSGGRGRAPFPTWSMLQYSSMW